MGKYKNKNQVKFWALMVNKVGKYKTKNWIKNGKKWVNIRIKIRLNFGF